MPQNLLMRQGVSAAELEAIKSNPLEAPLKEKDRLMLTFVNQAVKGEKGKQEEIAGRGGT